jgi:hypothetical protein
MDSRKAYRVPVVSIRGSRKTAKSAVALDTLEQLRTPIGRYCAPVVRYALTAKALRH